MTVTITHTATGYRATLPDGQSCQGSVTEVRTWARRRTPAKGSRFVTEARREHPRPLPDLDDSVRSGLQATAEAPAGKHTAAPLRPAGPPWSRSSGRGRNGTDNRRRIGEQRRFGEAVAATR